MSVPDGGGRPSRRMGITSSDLDGWGARGMAERLDAAVDGIGGVDLAGVFRPESHGGGRASGDLGFRHDRPELVAVDRMARSVAAHTRSHAARVRTRSGSARSGPAGSAPAGTREAAAVARQRRTGRARHHPSGAPVARGSVRTAYRRPARSRPRARALSCPTPRQCGRARAGRGRNPVLVSPGRLVGGCAARQRARACL